MRIPTSCGLSGHGISVTGGLCVDVPGRRAVIGTAAPGQRSPTGSPVDTTIVTALPGGAVDPPPGLCEITSPEGTFGSVAWVTVTVNPAFSRCDVAAFSFC